MTGLWNVCLSEMIGKESGILHLSRWFFQISSGWQQKLPRIMASQPTPLLTYLPPRNMALLRETNGSIGWQKKHHIEVNMSSRDP